jgi:hypothetical protein
MILIFEIETAYRSLPSRAQRQRQVQQVPQLDRQVNTSYVYIVRKHDLLAGAGAGSAASFVAVGASPSVAVAAVASAGFSAGFLLLKRPLILALRSERALGAA